MEGINVRLLSIQAENFGSYESLNFEFYKNGLTLISGTTGAGKTTLYDSVVWTLYGVTSKNGAADEICNWANDSTTKSTLSLEVRGKVFTVVRTRRPNDLYLVQSDNLPVRGKDLKDTQKLINDRLGVSAIQFLLGAYFHEFNQVSNFFTLNAKDRRVVFENLVNLDFPKQVKEKCVNYIKDLKEECQALEQKIKAKKDFEKHLVEAKNSACDSQKHWEKKRLEEISSLEYKFNNFEVLRSEALKKIEQEHLKFQQDVDAAVDDVQHNIDKLHADLKTDKYFEIKEKEINDIISNLPDFKCKECGATQNSDRRLILTKDLYSINSKKRQNEDLKKEIKILMSQITRFKTKVSPFLTQIDAEKQKENNYLELLNQKRSDSNPFDAVIQREKGKLEAVKSELSAIEAEVFFLKKELSQVESLIKLTDLLRAYLIENCVKFVETETNYILEKYFDAEIKVNFKLDEADDLDITIIKDGNTAYFTQLSKGQRQLLKLSFGITTMKGIRDNLGIEFNTLFFDEVFSGLDDELKIKGFNLLNSLTNENVFAIDHNSDLKTMFLNEFKIQLLNGQSTIEKA